jgi:hypothetical protein
MHSDAIGPMTGEPEIQHHADAPSPNLQNDIPQQQQPTDFQAPTPTPPDDPDATRQVEEDRQHQKDINLYADGVEEARRDKKLKADRATTIHNLALEAAARDKEQHAVKMDKAKVNNTATREDLKDGPGDANKRALAAGLWLSILRSPRLEGLPLLNQSWVASGQTEWTASLLDDMYNGPGGMTEFMSKHHLRFVPNLRTINGIAKTWLGGTGGLTPDDIPSRTAWDVRRRRPAVPSCLTYGPSQGFIQRYGTL